MGIKLTSGPRVTGRRRSNAKLLKFGQISHELVRSKNLQSCSWSSQEHGLGNLLVWGHSANMLGRDARGKLVMRGRRESRSPHFSVRLGCEVSFCAYMTLEVRTHVVLGSHANPLADEAGTPRGPSWEKNATSFHCAGYK